MLPPNGLFCFGLLTVSLVNISLSYSTSLPTFAALWALNGLQQGLAWPSLAKYILTDYSSSNTNSESQSTESSPRGFAIIWSIAMFVLYYYYYYYNNIITYSRHSQQYSLLYCV